MNGSGLVVIDADYNIVDKTKFSTPTMGVERLYHLELKLLDYLGQYKGIQCVCIEGPAMRELGRIFDIGGWAYLIYLTLYKMGIPYFVVAPLQLKKYVSGLGRNKGKAVVILDVFKNFGEEIRDDDIADAYVLSRISHDYFNMFLTDGESPEVRKYQLEVLKKINKSEKEKEDKALL